MGDKSLIEWTDATWNPILGCSKISPGCKNCYAIRTAHRLQENPNPKIAEAFKGLTVIEGGKPNWTGQVNFIADRLDQPLEWREPRMIFVNSQSDLFHEEVTDEQIVAIFSVVAACHSPSGDGHIFQILTKRPQRMSAFFERAKSISASGHAAVCGSLGLSITAAAEAFHYFRTQPFPNAWLGVSVESPTYKDRIDLLRSTPAAVRMLSLEPLLEDLGQLDLDGIHWVIVGGESGPDARPMHPDWARSVRDQCQAAGVPFFFKQWGEWAPLNQTTAARSSRANVHCFEDGLVAYKLGKRVVGRLLDGKEHSEYPKTAEASPQ